MYSFTPIVALLFFVMGSFPGIGFAQQPLLPSKAQEKIIIDTDIGTDIDDAFAIALALRSPELDIVGISTDSGDTEARAKILDRMLGEVGRQEIPVAVGNSTVLDPALGGSSLSQKRYGESGHFARATHPKAVDFILD